MYGEGYKECEGKQKEKYSIEQGSASYMQKIWYFWDLEKQKKIALTIYVSKTKYIINRKKK
jgi:hypothetical protein